MHGGDDVDSNTRRRCYIDQEGLGKRLSISGRQAAFLVIYTCPITTLRRQGASASPLPPHPLGG
jgi:hypothetical protein